MGQRGQRPRGVARRSCGFLRRHRHVARRAVFAAGFSRRHTLFRAHVAACSAHCCCGPAGDTRSAATTVALVAAAQYASGCWPHVERDWNAECRRHPCATGSCVGASHTGTLGLASAASVYGRVGKPSSSCDGTPELLSHRFAHVVGRAQAAPRAKWNWRVDIRARWNAGTEQRAWRDPDLFRNALVLCTERGSGAVAPDRSRGSTARRSHNVGADWFHLPGRNTCDNAPRIGRARDIAAYLYTLH